MATCAASIRARPSSQPPKRPHHRAHQRFRCGCMAQPELQAMSALASDPAGGHHHDEKGWRTLWRAAHAGPENDQSSAIASNAAGQPVL